MTWKMFINIHYKGDGVEVQTHYIFLLRLGMLQSVYYKNFKKLMNIEGK
jgi:hypothetical protein